MAKKFCSILLVFALILSFSACSLLLPQEVPDSEPEPVMEQIEWPLVSGVWAADVNGIYELVWMDTVDGENCFSIGIAGSDYYEGGPVSDLQDLGDGVYSFTVNVPKTEDNELSAGHKAYSFDASVDVSTLKDVKIRVAYGGEDFRDYYYVAPSMNGFDSSTLYGGSGGSGSGDTSGSSGGSGGTDTGSTALSWPLVNGVWINGDSGIYYFIYMDVYEGQNTFTLGALFSGYFEGGPISNLCTTMANVYEFDVNVAAVEENEMDSGHDAYTFHVECDLGNKDTGVIYLTIGGGAPTKYEYIADDLESIDINELYG